MPCRDPVSASNRAERQSFFQNEIILTESLILEQGNHIYSKQFDRPFHALTIILERMPNAQLPPIVDTYNCSAITTVPATTESLANLETDGQSTFKRNQESNSTTQPLLTTLRRKTTTQILQIHSALGKRARENHPPFFAQSMKIATTLRRTRLFELSQDRSFVSLTKPSDHTSFYAKTTRDRLPC